MGGGKIQHVLVAATLAGVLPSLGIGLSPLLLASLFVFKLALGVNMVLNFAVSEKFY